MAERREGTPASYVLTGLALIIATSIFAAQAELKVGIMVGGIGGAVGFAIMMVGVIAKGVQIGRQ